MDCASKKLKKMDDATSIASLPQEIILKILPTLPPKSAVSFRCTSKFFHSFIPQPHFAFRILFWVSSTNLYTVDYTTEETHGKLQPTSLQCSADELRRFELLFGSSFADGKLCMFNNRNGETTILDLSTRQHISLPRTSFHPNPGQKLQVAPDLENAAAIALPAVLHRVRLAAERSGRRADGVRVVAVGKTSPPLSSTKRLSKRVLRWNYGPLQWVQKETEVEAEAAEALEAAIA
nr:F-box only protein 8-like [Ipomoea batatas]